MGEFVQGVLHAVIKARPEDPIAYISTLCTYTDANSRGEKIAKPQAANAGPTAGEGKPTKKAEATKQTKPQSEAKKNVSKPVKTAPASRQVDAVENRTYEDAVAAAAQLADAAKEARETAERAAKAAEAAAAAAAQAAELAK